MYKILTSDGYKKFKGIRKINKKFRISILLESGHELKCSLDHKIFCNNKWIFAKDLKSGDIVKTKFGESKIFFVDLEEGSFDFYDFVGVENHKYFTNDIESHNCDFLGSADTLIHPAKLRAIPWTTPIQNSWGVDIYESPQKNHIYVISADTSHGVSLDYSAFVVIDVTEFPYKLVAKFRNNTTSPMLYPEILAKTGWDYNTAHILCEAIDVGYTVAESLHRDLEYENVITTISKGRAGQKIGGGFGGTGSKPMFGVKTNKAIKHIGCVNLKDIIEGDKLIIQDYDIIQELSTFVAKKNSYEAEDGCHDDLVMSLVLFGWLVRQQMFKDLTNTDIRRQLAQEKYAELMEELPLAGFIDPGMGDEYIESIDPHSNSFRDPFRL